MTPKLDTTKERHKFIMETYNAVIKKYGNMAKHLKKTLLYEEVASIVHLTPKYVQGVISELLRN